jgi:hypothetical protein
MRVRARARSYLFECVLQKLGDGDVRVGAAAARCMARLDALGLLKPVFCVWVRWLMYVR